MRTAQLYSYFILKSPQINLKSMLHKFYIIIIIINYNNLKKGVIMILGSSFEFERHQNPEIVERESDNFELPQVFYKLDVFQFILPSLNN